MSLLLVVVLAVALHGELDAVGLGLGVKLAHHGGVVVVNLYFRLSPLPHTPMWGRGENLKYNSYNNVRTEF